MEIHSPPDQFEYQQTPSPKVTKMVQIIRTVDGASDADVTDAKPQPETNSSRRNSHFNGSPGFVRPTKASQARAQKSKYGKISRKNTDDEEQVMPTRDTVKITENGESVTFTMQTPKTSTRPFPSEVAEMYIVLQYEKLFPHCKAHGVFLNIVEANNKVVELFKADEEGRHTGNRGKVQPYISEHGCLQYYRHGTSPKSMVWVARVPFYPEGKHDALLQWPNEEERKTMLAAAGPERRKAAGGYFYV